MAGTLVVRAHGVLDNSGRALVDAPTRLKLARFVLNCVHSHGYTLVCCAATLVEPAIAQDAGQHLLHALARRCFLAAFGKCQRIDENRLRRRSTIASNPKRPLA